MIDNNINTMIELVQNLKEDIKLDIEDIKQAHHEKLLNRNDIKLEKMTQIATLKEQLNSHLIEAVQSGVDVERYKESIDNLENELQELFDLNGRLASIVLPVKEMYKEIIDDITKANGGVLLEVHA
jgi:hypothetical protein